MNSCCLFRRPREHAEHPVLSSEPSVAQPGITAARRVFSLTLPVTQGDAVDRLSPRPLGSVGSGMTGLLEVTVGRWLRCLLIQRPGRQATASCPTWRAKCGKKVTAGLTVGLPIGLLDGLWPGSGPGWRSGSMPTRDSP